MNQYALSAAEQASMHLCSKCNHWWPKSEFVWGRHGTEQTTARCMNCRRPQGAEYDVTWYANHNGWPYGPPSHTRAYTAAHAQEGALPAPTHAGPSAQAGSYPQSDAFGQPHVQSQPDQYAQLGLFAQAPYPGQGYPPSHLQAGATPPFATAHPYGHGAAPDAHLQSSASASQYISQMPRDYASSFDTPFGSLGNISLSGSTYATAQQSQQSATSALSPSQYPTSPNYNTFYSPSSNVGSTPAGSDASPVWATANPLPDPIRFRSPPPPNSFFGRGFGTFQPPGTRQPPGNPSGHDTPESSDLYGVTPWPPGMPRPAPVRPPPGMQLPPPVRPPPGIQMPPPGFGPASVGGTADSAGSVYGTAQSQLSDARGASLLPPGMQPFASAAQQPATSGTLLRSHSTAFVPGPESPTTPRRPAPINTRLAAEARDDYRFIVTTPVEMAAGPVPSPRPAPAAPRSRVNPQGPASGRPKGSTSAVAAPAVMPPSAAYFWCTGGCARARPTSVLAKQYNVNGNEPACQYCVDGGVDITKRLVYCVGGGHAENEVSCPLRECARHQPQPRPPVTAPIHNLTRQAPPTSRDFHQADLDRIQRFTNTMDAIQLAQCAVCRRDWFSDDLRINNGTCRECSSRALKDGDVHLPPFFGTENSMQPPPMPANLPRLSILEERMCSIMHTSSEIAQVRPGESKGKIISHLHDEARLYTTLPVPVEQINYTIIIPTGYDASQFHEETMVDRENVRKFLLEMKRINPRYRDVTIDNTYINTLPLVRTSMVTSLPTHTTTPSSITALPTMGRPMRVAMPNLLARPIPSTHSAASTTFTTIPIMEVNKTRPFLSLSFPTLYPTGEGDWISPRSRHVRFEVYVRNFLTHSDKRFAQHPQWLFYVFNILMNRQINTRSTYLGKEIAGALTEDELRAALQDDDLTILRRVFDYGSQVVVGSAPWWQGQRKKLWAMVNMIGDPNLFVTLSSNLLEWTDLHAVLPGFIFGHPHTRQEIQDMVDSNPAIVTRYIMTRQSTFFEQVLKPLFDVEDWWGRVEYQKNGVIHWHTVLWTANSPKPKCDTSHQRDVLAAFWNAHVEAWQHPTTSNIPDIRATVDLYQTHSCAQSPGCTPSACRYGLINIPNRDKAGLVQRVTGKWFFEPKRNKNLITSYNRVVLVGWGGNISVDVLTGNKEILAYVSKANTPSTYSADNEVGEIVSSLTSAIHTSPTLHPVLSRVTSSLAQLVGGREYSVQEICHNLLQLNLIHSSRSVIKIDTRVKSDQSQHSVLNRYLNRNVLNHSNMTMLEFALFRDPRNVTRTLAKCQVPMYIPNPAVGSSDMARMKMLLHHPFQLDESSLYTAQNLSNYAQAYDSCRTLHAPHQRDYLLSNDAVVESVEDLEAFNTLLELIRSQHDYQNTTLGQRDIDLAMDWSPHVGQLDVMGIDRNFWSASAPVDPSPTLPSSPTVSAADVTQHDLSIKEILSSDQLEVYDHVIPLADTLLSSAMADKPFLVQIDGGPGTGKSFLLESIYQRINRFATSLGYRGTPVIKAAPTGVAARNIQGSTIHETFDIGIKGYLALDATKLADLRQKLAGLRVVILDEKSMIDRVLLTSIDQRCRELTALSDKFFGGLSVILVGDFFQLEPYTRWSLFKSDMCLSYLAFTKSFFLTTAHRQDQDVVFQRILTDIRNARGMSDVNWKALTARCMSEMSEADIHTFNDAIRLYYTWNQVDRYNAEQITKSLQPVLSIPASGNNSRVKSDEAGDLPSVLTLTLGSRVMVMENLSIHDGVVNGSFGTVKDIRWRQGEVPRRDPPYAVLVELDNHTGRTLPNPLPDGSRVIPIFRSTHTVQHLGLTYRRTQFPLILAWATTVHRSQSLTLQKVVLDISQHQFTSGLLYTAISRVKTLGGLLLEEPVDKAMFDGPRTESEQQRLDDERRRRAGQ
ncbi:hypothetical protein D6C91_05668 [Aureobasidium pullulans]|uniref:ATP-dependent DNA helicase n=1 Tax=Aureobasidium pullulans TaxID=5580 RepID=A0A4S9T1T5_AURPU|nr:hypothetical protein D6C91_05668 [Aureobasidium pullulans]